MLELNLTDKDYKPGHKPSYVPTGKIEDMIMEVLD